MSTEDRLVLVPLQEAEFEYLATEQIEFLTGEHRLDGVPGVWSPRPDTPLGARLTLGPDETVTVDGETVRGQVDLVAYETVRLDEHRSVDVLVDNQNGELKPALLVVDWTSPRLAAAAGVLAYPDEPRWRREVRFVPETDPDASTAFLRLNDGERIFHRRRVGWFDVDFGEFRRSLEITDDGREQYVSFGDETDVLDAARTSARMIWLRRPAEQTEVLDFNTAVLNPFAFNPAYSCPFPPDGGRLPIAVTAGRRRLLLRATQPSRGRWPSPRPKPQRAH